MFIHIITITQKYESGEPNYILYILVTLGLVLGYVSIKPVIKWFIKHKTYTLLSYIMISFILFTVVSSIYFLLGLSTELFHISLKALLQTLACFGGGLVLWNLMKIAFTKYS
ncbi:hypothetical protein [Oceanobacillus manasiensis]|uniref:hypothetical protein n=1 Tax=Oceanobacillus manasiensis TaxID=586413 RepID=UPI0005A99AE5|nr:hypothetical protein [Oceanobacillus manasiensis]